MFCSKCKAEYKPGISHCPECDVDWVETLPPEENVEFIKVFESSDPGLTAIIKSILDGAGIKYFVTGENMQSILGAKFEFAFCANIGNAVFLVKKEDEATVLELLKELPENAHDSDLKTE